MAYKRRSSPGLGLNRVFGCIFPPNTETAGSVPEILEGMRRRADYDVTLRLDLEHREAALHEPARGKTEQPVDSGEPARVEDRLLRERLRAATARQNSGECCGVVAERCQAWRIMAVDFPEVLLEDPPRLGRRRGEPAPDERRLIADIGHVPEPAAEQLNRLRVDLRLFDLAGDLFEPRTTFGQQQGVERGRGRCGGI